MLTISIKQRKIFGRKLKSLRAKGFLPAVIYGPGIKNLSIEIDSEKFLELYKRAGESSLISLNLQGEDKKFLVLIYDVEFDPLSGKPISVDFYQPNLKEKVEIAIPLNFVGQSPAVKKFNGTLVRDIQEIEVKAFPQNLPKEIKVDISSLKELNDEILVKDLVFPEDVEVSKKPEEVVAYIAPPENVEEELEKPIEEKVEEVEKIEKEEKPLRGENKEEEVTIEEKEKKQGETKEKKKQETK